MKLWVAEASWAGGSEELRSHRANSSTANFCLELAPVIGKA